MGRRAAEGEVLEEGFFRQPWRLSYWVWDYPP